MNLVFLSVNLCTFSEATKSPMVITFWIKPSFVPTCAFFRGSSNDILVKGGPSCWDPISRTHPPSHSCVFSFWTAPYLRWCCRPWWIFKGDFHFIFYGIHSFFAFWWGYLSSWFFNIELGNILLFWFRRPSDYSGAFSQGRHFFPDIKHFVILWTCEM